ncbi:hypothetical protein FRB93_000838 [Tulasnella sp. JGI-2019a]|nr:hypothetical protein FRB93_000838 [Tulasnella sp. JGI-2019a]
MRVRWQLFVNMLAWACLLYNITQGVQVTASHLDAGKGMGSGVSTSSTAAPRSKSITTTDQGAPKGTSTTDKTNLDQPSTSGATPTQSVSAPTLGDNTRTPCSSTTHGLSTNDILAIVGLLSTTIISAVAVWQEMRYPMREHRKKVRALDIELQTMIVQQRIVEGILTRQTGAVV